MLTHHRLPVCLSLVSTDLPLWFTLETAATIYQKDQERFHLLLKEPAIQGLEPEPSIAGDTNPLKRDNHRLLWLEISPYRVNMTMQGKGNVGYRHLWEKGVYGISRYWIQSEPFNGHKSIQLRNYTRMLKLEGRPFPERLELEYELWSEKLHLGHYVLTLQIHHQGFPQDD
ncbi:MULTISPECIES: hypothetical protein [unclassified Coleofasciculus]|uniref:hypothetical protein n=1 Tax=unclassified Coleofasciculus TaxID=2692782 RepID=UPI0018825561|nr:MULTISPECIES: hypothetical protein [unclassified Coleofasciculus]MBE9126364.1 hypothetical protein [Coleofasciculus sp. LEGE 07081]MBE9150017.1 hypothetical protein [Coleofasciculus sp. LEGE 07092]